jgi:rhodanese-related sulfurtransferase
MNFKHLILKATIIIIVSVLCGLIYNSVSESGIALIYESLNLESGSYLTTEQTKMLLNEGRTLFIDTRYEDEYKEGHLKNAKNIPANMNREDIMTFFETIPKDQQIVVYCSSAACNSSRRLAGFLIYLGYKNVYVYLEGYQEWERQHYPVE